MAFYIEIKKVKDNSDYAEYTFWADNSRPGKLKLDKATGEVHAIEHAPGDEPKALFSRAAHKVKKHWSAGELPETTCWAS